MQASVIYFYMLMKLERSLEKIPCQSVSHEQSIFGTTASIFLENVSKTQLAF